MSRGLSLAACLCAATGAVAVAVVQAQDPVFKASVDGVRIDVLVAERGRPVANLGPGDFDVRDSGIPQTIDLVSLGDVPVGVVLALDLSSSVRGPKLDALRRAGHALVGGLRAEDQAALLTFNTAVTLRVPMTAETATLAPALDAATSGGDTALVDAAVAAMLLGDADAGRPLIVLFSDGVDTASFTQPAMALETARRVNGVVYGVTSSGDRGRFLRDLASATGGRVLDIEDDNPTAAFLEILQEFRRRYVITFTPTGVTPGGWHPLEVRVKRGGVRIQARSGYFSAAR